MKKSIGVGLMGLGTVGGGVAKALSEKDRVVAEAVGCPVVLRKILEQRPVAVEPRLLTKDVREILTDPEIDIVIEVLGGEHPAVDYIKEALLSGKHVVTANKEVIAKHGAELAGHGQGQRRGSAVRGQRGRRHTAAAASAARAPGQ